LFLQVVNLPFLPGVNIIPREPQVKGVGAKAPFLADDAARHVAAFGQAAQGFGAFKAQVGGGFNEG
jgi:hypothetical protein